MVIEPARPIEHDGIRYQVALTDEGGRLEGGDARSGDLLWELSIQDWADGGSGEWPFITDLDIRDGRLLIKDIMGRRFSMDLVTRQVGPWMDEMERVSRRDMEIYSAVLEYLRVVHGRTDWVVLQSVRTFPEAAGLEVETFGAPECELHLWGDLPAETTSRPAPDLWSRTLSFTRVAYDPATGEAFVGAYCATEVGQATFRVGPEGTVTAVAAGPPRGKL